MFHDPDDDDEEDAPWAAEAEHLGTHVTPELREDLEQLGIHISTIMLGVRNDDRAELIFQGVLGPLAFTERVQRPDQARFDDAFADLEEAMVNDEFEQRRKRLLDEMGDGR